MGSLLVSFLVHRGLPKHDKRKGKVYAKDKTCLQGKMKLELELKYSDYETGGKLVWWKKFGKKLWKLQWR